MRGPARGLLLLAVLGPAAAGLTACGSGTGASTSTTTGPTGATSTPSAPAPKHSAKAHPSRRGARAQAPGRGRAARLNRQGPPPVSAALKRKAGRAAPFLVPAGDNSVPTYGSESSETERGAAEASLRSFLEARAAGDWATACRYLAASTRSRLEGLAKGSRGKTAGCAPVLKAFAGAGPASTRANSLIQGLLSFRVKGSTGFALWVGPHNQKYAMPMAREGGAWRPTQIAPLPYPPGSVTMP